MHRSSRRLAKAANLLTMTPTAKANGAMLTGVETEMPGSAGALGHRQREADSVRDGGARAGDRQCVGSGGRTRALGRIHGGRTWRYRATSAAGDQQHHERQEPADNPSPDALAAPTSPPTGQGKWRQQCQGESKRGVPPSGLSYAGGRAHGRHGHRYRYGAIGGDGYG